MITWKTVQNYLPDWFSTAENQIKSVKTEQSDDSQGDDHLQLARNSLRNLLADTRVPSSVRKTLHEEYSQLQATLEKLENGHLHVAVFGRVSVGKSSILNALIGKKVFSTSLLHGETKTVGMEAWDEYQDGGVYLLDTPGINEIEGEEREAMAHDVASRADLLLFVIDSDLTDIEMQALTTVAQVKRPILLIINKADQFNDDEKLQLRQIIRNRVKHLLPAENIVFAAAQPMKQTVIYIDENGDEHETIRQRPVEIVNLKSRLWDILESEGKTLNALNASIFAGDITEKVNEKILVARQTIAQETIRMYCIGKGVAVAVNPIPIADLIAAAAVDVGMIIHLSRIFALPMTNSEAGGLIKTIAGQMIALYGSTWVIHFISSALKIGTGGFSTLLTAAAQGAIAYYSTLVIGQAIQRYLVNGKTWGDAGPKFVVQQILDSLDRDSIMAEAREEILNYLRKSKKQ